MTNAARVSLGLAWRSLILVRRMPSIFVPSLVMPLFILVATAGAFRGIAELPALEGVDYTAFTIPLATVMGAGFAGVNAGLTMARDIEGGFVDRLVASPAPRATLIAGPLVATAARSLITTTVVLVAGLLFGVGLPGPAGTLVVYVMALGFACATACWAMGIALRTRTVQSAPLIQVVVFMSIFTSVAYAPREVLGGWLRTVADWNPVTRVLETSRAAELEAVTWDVLWPGLLAAGGLVAALGAFTALGLAGLGEALMAQRRLPVEGPLGDHLDALLAAPDPIAARYAEVAGEPGAQMMTHPDLGRLLAALVVATGGRAVLEVGTFVGISAAWMAGSLSPGGRLDTLEADPGRAARAEDWFARIGIDDRVAVHRGPAAETMATLPEGAYDLCYIDADKAGYPAYLVEAVRLVRPGGLIVADNVLAGGRVAQPPEEDAPGTAGLRRFATDALAHPRLITAILTVGDGVSVSAVR